MELEIDKMKVAELKAALAERGLDTKGNKAALVERLQAASDEGDHGGDDDHQDVDQEAEEADLYNPEEETPTSPDNNGDTNNEENGFENQEFVRSKPSGISFGLHEPTKVKPQPKELAPLVSQDDNNDGPGDMTHDQVRPESLFTAAREAAVPLPPTTSFMEESDDDEEEGPPGLGNVELPPNIFNKPVTSESHDKPKTSEAETVNWRRYEAVVETVPETCWVSGRYIQSPALFLQEEAEMAGEEVVYELEDNDVPGLSPTSVKMQLTYFDSTVTAQGDTEEEAMHAAAMEMLKETGPWIPDSMYEEVTTSIMESLPQDYSSWAPPRYNLSHVSMLDSEGATFVGEQPGRKLYKLEVVLGPVKCVVVTDHAKEAVSNLASHLNSFLNNRNLKALSESTEEQLEESTKKYKYVLGSGIVSVSMEGEGKTPVLPPLDIFILQTKIKNGLFPAQYGARDEYGCSKVFTSELCQTRLAGPEAEQMLRSHVESERHQRRLGRFFFKNVLIETFRPAAAPHIPRNDSEDDPAELDKYCVKICSTCEEDGNTEIATGYCEECEDYLCKSCVEAHRKTKLTKNHTIREVAPAINNHPRKDAAEGREVKPDSEGYLIRIYRCATVKGKGVREAGGSRWGAGGGGAPAPGMMPGPGGMMGPGMMMGPGPGWGHPGMMGAGPRPPGPGFGPPGAGYGGPGGPGNSEGGGQEEAAPVKSGLVNDPMANISNNPQQQQPGPGQFPGGPGGPPGQWGPWGPGPQGPGGWGGPPGPWGPRPPGPPGMICVSQGVSGKMCKHFSRGQCTYGNRCIHLHLVPNPQAQMQQQQANNPEGEESEEDDEDDEEEGGESSAATPATHNMGGMGRGMPMPGQPQKSMFEKREDAKARAFEEAMAAAKAAAAKTGDLSSHLVTSDNQGGGRFGGNNAGGGVNVLGPSVMHAYSVGQKSKKKDPKPEEQRPGDWQCECGNYNFAWRKECNACGRKKPHNQMEEDAKQAELARIKADREKRRAAARGDGGGGGRLDPGDLRNGLRGNNRDRDRDRDSDRRDRGRDDRDRDRRGGGRDRDRDDSNNANMVPLGRDRGRRDSGDRDDDRARRRDRDRDDDRDRKRDRDRDRGRDDDRDRDRERDRDRDRNRDYDKDRHDDRDRDRDRDDDKERDRHRDRDRDDRDYEREEKKKSKDKKKDKDRDREESHHSHHSHKDKKEKKRKRSKEYDSDDYESSGKKHKKSHKSGRDDEGHSEKKKKKKEKDRDKDEKRRHRKSQEEEGEIPGDWGEWYDQGRGRDDQDDRY